MKILYVNHTSTVGGAERSLLDLLCTIGVEIDPLLACPEGELAERARAIGIDVWRTRPVPLGFRLHPVVTSRGLLVLGAVALDIARAARQHRAEIVHANSVRAGLAAIAARAAGSPPPIVHVRDVLPVTRTGRLVSGLTCRGSLRVLANSRFTAASFGCTKSGHVRVVYNGIEVGRFARNSGDRRAARHALRVPIQGLTLGVIAQLTPWKAQDDAIRILDLVRHSVPDAHLLLVGAPSFQERWTGHDNFEYAAELSRLADQLGLNGAVRFLGKRADVRQILSALDILLVPSWQEPFGRAIVEAMAAETAVVATAHGGPAEIIRHEETGLLLAPRDPVRWAREIVALWADCDRRSRLVDRARREVGAFSIAAHAAAVRAHYRAALAEVIP